ncbi:MAG: hypothetical protein QM622_03790 [Microbacterium sp.]
MRRSRAVTEASTPDTVASPTPYPAAVEHADLSPVERYWAADD